MDFKSNRSSLTDGGDIARWTAPLLSVLSHTAVWIGMYAAAAVVCVAQVSGLDNLVRPRAKVAAAIFAFCTATGVYLLDRVKLRDAWLDPADAQAHPSRFAFLSDHTRLVRRGMGTLLFVATVCGFMTWPLLACVPIGGAVGVMVYAGRPRAGRPRPKDVLVLKNMYVAVGMTGFAIVVTLAAADPVTNANAIRHLVTVHGEAILWAGVFLMLRVLADAVLSDLDDTEADRRFGTHTVPQFLGREGAWDLAASVRLCAALALALMSSLPFVARTGWAAVTVISALALRAAAPRRLVDWVDARFALEALCVTVLLAVVGGS